LEVDWEGKAKDINGLSDEEKASHIPYWLAKLYKILQ
jgi:hypothetical protein